MSVLTVNDDETVEMLLQRLEADGMDMTVMRAARDDLSLLEVGDPTPPPGSLLIEPTLVLPPPVHQGFYDTAEGPFILPVSARATKPDKRLTLRGLNRDVRFLRQVIVAVVIMFIVTQTAIVLVVKS